MRKILKYLVFILLFVVTAIIALVYYSDVIINWTPISAKESPNKVFLASGYNYDSDGDRHAPYGTYVFLTQSNIISRPTKGHVVFAGYCENNLTLLWQSNTELTIKCKMHKKAAVRSLSSVAYGVAIKFEPE